MKKNEFIALHHQESANIEEVKKYHRDNIFKVSSNGVETDLDVEQVQELIDERDRLLKEVNLLQLQMHLLKDETYIEIRDLRNTIKEILKINDIIVGD